MRHLIIPEKFKGAILVAIQATKELDILKPVESTVNHMDSFDNGVVR